MSIDVPFSRENLDKYLMELAKDFKKRSHGQYAEIILVGGASIIINYNFRLASYDIDADYIAYSTFKESIKAVATKFNLPTDWLNDDFKKTSSYSPKIVQYSEEYKVFCGKLAVRTVRAEYLVAMKLVSGRQYKKDLSDIAGIIYEQEVAGSPLTFESIDKAVINLYGDWSCISDYSKETLNKILSCDNLKELFVELSENEENAKATLVEIDRKYPKIVNKDNVEEVIAAALKKQKKD